MIEYRNPLVPIDPAHVCRVCGCRDYETCEGGCWWTTRPVEPNPICSKCEDTSAPERAGRVRALGTPAMTSGAEPRTQASRELLAHIERLGYDAYDAARAFMEDRGGGGWPEALALIERESLQVDGHPLIGGYCPICSGSCLVGFGND